MASAVAVALLHGTWGCVPAPRSFSIGERPAQCRIAILPLANYSEMHSAPDRIAPVLAAELGRRAGIEVVEPGAVEAALSAEPWLLFDRVPPDLLARFGEELAANAILVGSVLAYGERESGAERVPEVSLSLRLIAAPDGRILWSAVHSRSGDDGEWLFGLGRVRHLEQLAGDLVREMLDTFPGGTPDAGAIRTPLAEGERS